MDDRQQDDARARNRFMVINAVRIGGVLMILAGLAISNGALDLPEPVAWALIALGMLETFLFPTLLARMWSGNERDGTRRP